jgi:type IV secretory pathway component VirB8
MLNSFLSGAIFMACLAIAMHFFLLWRRSGDRLFTYFLAAFITLAAERVILVAVSPINEFAPFVYLVRLLAFGFIIVGVIDKNRTR